MEGGRLPPTAGQTWARHGRTRPVTTGHDWTGWTRPDTAGHGVHGSQIMDAPSKEEVRLLIESAREEALVVVDREQSAK